MSIEWLLAKTAGTVTQRKPPEKSHKKDRLSEKIHGSKSRELNQETDESDEERLCRAENSCKANMQNRTSEINLRCSCGYIGTVTQNKTDFKLLRTDKNGFAYFECSNCRRHLRYDSSTGEIKIQKGLLAVLFRKFS